MNDKTLEQIRERLSIYMLPSDLDEAMFYITPIIATARREELERVVPGLGTELDPTLEKVMARIAQLTPSPEQSTVDCPECGKHKAVLGARWRPLSGCPTCNGTGRVSRTPGEA